MDHIDYSSSSVSPDIPGFIPSIPLTEEYSEGEMNFENAAWISESDTSISHTEDILPEPENQLSSSDDTSLDLYTSFMSSDTTLMHSDDTCPDSEGTFYQEEPYTNLCSDSTTFPTSHQGLIFAHTAATPNIQSEHAYLGEGPNEPVIAAFGAPISIEGILSVVVFSPDTIISLEEDGRYRMERNQKFIRLYCDHAPCLLCQCHHCAQWVFNREKFLSQQHDEDNSMSTIQGLSVSGCAMDPSGRFEGDRMIALCGEQCIPNVCDSQIPENNDAWMQPVEQSFIASLSNLPSQAFHAGFQGDLTYNPPVHNGIHTPIMRPRQLVTPSPSSIFSGSVKSSPASYLHSYFSLAAAKRFAVTPSRRRRQARQGKAALIGKNSIPSSPSAKLTSPGSATKQEVGHPRGNSSPEFVSFGGVRVTLAELLALFPNAFRMPDVCQRICDLGISHFHHCAFLNYTYGLENGTGEGEQGHQWRPNTMLKSVQRIMRGKEGLADSAWTFKRHARNEAVGVETEGWQEPEGLAPIKMAELARNVVNWPREEYCLDVARAVKYAAEHEGEALMFPQDVEAVVERLGGRKAVPQERNIDVEFKKEWARQMKEDESLAKYKFKG